MKRTLAYLFAALSFCLAVPAGAQQGRVVHAGLSSSFKGVGVELMREMDTRTESFSLTADFGGTLIRDIHDAPGLKFSWRVHYPVGKIHHGRGYDMHFYFGPGLSTGYVRDYTVKNDRGFGFMTGICANEGLLLEFKRRSVSIALELAQELGFHMTRTGESDALAMGLYKRGIYSGYFPEVKIFIDFGRRAGR